jgi:hypothetical protein
VANRHYFEFCGRGQFRAGAILTKASCAKPGKARHGFAVRRLRIERALPAFARMDALSRIDIEKEVVPALSQQPTATAAKLSLPERDRNMRDTARPKSKSIQFLSGTRFPEPDNAAQDKSDVGLMTMA